MIVRGAPHPPSPASRAPPSPTGGEGLRRLALKPDAIDYARKLRRDSTEAEKRLWRALRSQLPDAKFRRQVPLGLYFADFCSHAARLIIEVDGGQHADAIERDRVRTKFIENEGYRVIRFWNNEVIENLDGVVETIAAALRS